MKIFTAIWKIWYFLLNLLVVILIAPIIIVLSIFNNTYTIIYFLLRLWAYILFYGIGMRYELFSKQELDNENYVIISNHTSVLDVMLMIILHPQHPLTFVGKKELAKIPLFGLAYKKICILVDRKSVRSKARVYKMASEKIQEGRSLVIFPEGGVTENEEEILLPFKEGAFTIAKEAEVGLVVYSIKGLKEAFPFDFWKGKPMKIQVWRERVYTPTEVTQKTVKELKDESVEMITQRFKSEYPS